MLPRAPRSSSPTTRERVDPDDVWSTVERERANTMTVVGDAVLRPLVLQLDRKKYDLSSFFAVGNGGAPLTPAVRAMAMERLLQPGDLRPRPDPRRPGRRCTRTSVDAVEVGPSLPRPRHRRGGRIVRAGAPAWPRGGSSDGWLETGSVPLGYLGDPEKAARTFPEDRRGALLHSGRPGAAPGGRADRAAGARLGDGQLGRREDLRRGGGAGHRRPSGGGRRRGDRGDLSERWGSEVVAVVQLAPGVETDAASIAEHASTHIARYKLPKDVVFVEHIERSPSGKADYRWAAETALGEA